MSIAVMLAAGVNADGHREIVGIDVATAEDGAGWLTFFRDLSSRGPTGVKLVTSGAHSGLVAAIGATLPGASWQRCRTHYAANLMYTCLMSSWPWVKALLHSVDDQVEATRADVLASTAFPKEAWRQIWSNKPNERLYREIRRRNDGGILPDRTNIIRLVGAELAEQHAEWAEGRHYLALEVLARSRVTTVLDCAPQATISRRSPPKNHRGSRSNRHTPRPGT